MPGPSDLSPSDLTADLLSGVRLRRESRPAAHRQAVFLAVDRAFYPFALFVADQIRRKSATVDFDICILSAEDLPPHPLWDLRDLRVCAVQTEDLARKLPTDARITFSAYLRIMAPRLLAADYDRLLYLDADVFYRRGDLSRLLSLDLGDHALAAVRDMNQLRKPARVPNDFKPFGLGHARYFNSGMMLIDVPRWNAARIGERALHLAATQADRVLQHDQTALNVTLQGDWAELPLIWNFLFSHQTAYFAAMFDVCFFHFVGRRKPFKGSYGGFPHHITQEYRDFFAAHFPEYLDRVQGPLDIDREWPKHALSLAFHLLNVRRFLRNTDWPRSDFDLRQG